MVSIKRFLKRFFRGEYAHPTGRWIINPETGKKERSEATRDQMLRARGRATQARVEQGEKFMTRRRNKHPDGKYGVYTRQCSKGTAKPKVRKDDPEVKPPGGRGERARERRREKTSVESPSELPVEMSGGLPGDSPELPARSATELVSDGQPVHSSDHIQGNQGGSSEITNGHGGGDLSGRREQLQSGQQEESVLEQPQERDRDSQDQPSPQSQAQQDPPPPEEENGIQQQQQSEGAQAQPVEQPDAQLNGGLQAHPTQLSTVPPDQQSQVPPIDSAEAESIRQGIPLTTPGAQAQSTQDTQIPTGATLQVFRVQQDRPRQHPRGRSNREVQERSNRRQLERLLGELREDWDRGLEERLGRHDQRLLDELQRLLGQPPLGSQPPSAMVRTASPSEVSQRSMQSSSLNARSGSGFLGGFRSQWRSVVQWWRGF